ncbi:hypothetical protein MAPG_08727 [Magnaporthiopsis poae ATCC 64411]|uniref:Uncharacterized protein n=1 Tax=Magnaporthiopsis poae (strain ATCC 64411 / 73-15) TaxID=644358 RepID=A0A0C4E839_MAGP6|nr:hypothetical protein MAPG_08727 [Magnaporthiopsis poae ATCC 64411]
MSAMAAQVQTLWSLPAAPLIQGDLVGAIFVMIWFVLTLLFAYVLHTLLSRSQPTWPEFKDTLYSALVLAFWYFTVVLDRWLRKDNRAVVYGYIVWLALCEFVRVVAGIYLQWGLYKVVWRELVARGRVEHANLWRWWLAAKLAIALVFLVAAHYLVLQLTTAAVWVRFDSLNTIQDIATKRNAFAITTAVFSMVFAALTVFAATNAMRKSHLTDGGVTKTRMALWAATVILLARALSEIGTTAIAVSPNASFHDVTRARDISYGLLTCLYFVLICVHASGVSRPSDRGNEDTRAIESNIRKHILDMLRDRTDGAKLRSPDFDDILHDLESRLDALLAPGNPANLAQGSTMSEANNKRAAMTFIHKLRERVLPDLNPREGRSWQEEERARNETVFDRFTRSAGSVWSRGTRKAAAGSSSLHTTPVPVVTRGERHLGRLRSERAAESRYARPLPSQTRPPLGQDVEMTDVRGHRS